MFKKAVQILLLFIFVISLSSCGADKEDTNNKQPTTQEDISKKIKDETKADMKEISQKVSNGEITDEQAQKEMINALENSKTFKNQLEKSKKEMPKILELMKASKDCLIDADNTSDAKECDEESKKLAKKLGIYDTMYRDYKENNKEDLKWDNEIKKNALKEMDEGIQQMEKIMPCIEKANTVKDMMKCGMDN